MMKQVPAPSSLGAYKGFLNYLKSIYSTETSEEELLSLYDELVTITLNGHKVHIPFDAVICEQLINLMKTMIKEY